MVYQRISTSRYAIRLLEKNLDKISWVNLSMNIDKSYAIHILEKHIDKIDWRELSLNPSIFEIDMKQMKLELTKKANSIDF